MILSLKPLISTKQQLRKDQQINSNLYYKQYNLFTFIKQVIEIPNYNITRFKAHLNLYNRFTPITLMLETHEAFKPHLKLFTRR